MARKHRDVMRVLTADIVSGERPAGEMLPKEVDLASEFDVSRGVARETIRAMEERGLISVKHGKGATVNEPAQWDVFDPDVLAGMLDSSRQRGVLAEYLEALRILEVQAAGVAAERAKRRDVERLAAALGRVEEAAARPPSQEAAARFREADLAFHQALIAATGNRALSALVGRLHSAMLLARVPRSPPKQPRDHALADEHRRIVAAVEAGDVAEARQAMSEHLDTIASELAWRRTRGAVRP
jgi:DNA-binding FadR family transcriptional regulator